MSPFGYLDEAYPQTLIQARMIEGRDRDRTYVVGAVVD